MEFGTERIARYLEHIGDPQNNIPAIHVVGTNGKGSICAFLTSVMREAGLQVGTFTSPYFMEPRDGIRINGQPVSAHQYRSTLAAIEEETSGLSDLRLSSFELDTVAAFKFFNEARVDVMIIEAGMGGKLDATNVLTSPLLCILSSLSVDHEAILGGWQSILAHKLAVGKPGVPFFVAPQSSLALAHNSIVPREAIYAEIQRTAAELALDRIYFVDQNVKQIGKDTSRFSFESAVEGGRTISFVSGLTGPHQGGNAAVAIDACLHLSKYGPPHIRASLSLGIILRGIQRARWPGRLSWLNASLLVDGAHNPAGAATLAAYLVNLDRSRVRKGKGPLQVRLVLGMSHGKDIQGFVQSLLIESVVSFLKDIALVDFDGPKHMPWVKAMSRADLECALRLLTRSIPIHSSASLDALLAQPTSLNMITLVTGSLYVMPHVYRILNLDPYA